MYYTNTKIPNGQNARIHIQNTANTLIGAQISTENQNGGRYTCCEGQIVARLFDTASPAGGAAPLFPQVIANLIVEANNHLGGGAPITDQNIELVVLHIHSRYDPCAKCSRVLSGLSRQVNIPIVAQNQAIRNLLTTPNFAGTPIANGALFNLFTRLGNGNTRFLIEVSSNEPYNFDAGANCSCAELAGMDVNVANAINIPAAPTAINFNTNGLLSIPNADRWYFPLTFPPYTVYGRVVHPGGAIWCSWRSLSIGTSTGR